MSTYGICGGGGGGTGTFISLCSYRSCAVMSMCVSFEHIGMIVHNAMNATACGWIVVTTREIISSLNRTTWQDEHVYSLLQCAQCMVHK